MRAVMLAVAEMYVRGVSARQTEAVLREFGIEGMSSSQVSRAAALLDEGLEAWRNSQLGEIRHLIFDEKWPGSSEQPLTFDKWIVCGSVVQAAACVAS